MTITNTYVYLNNIYKFIVIRHRLLKNYHFDNYIKITTSSRKIQVFYLNQTFTNWVMYNQYKHFDSSIFLIYANNFMFLDFVVALEVYISFWAFCMSSGLLFIECLYQEKDIDIFTNYKIMFLAFRKFGIL